MVALRELRKMQSSTYLKSMIDRFRTFSNVFERFRTLLNVFERFRTFSNVFERFRTISNNFERFRTFSNVFERFRTFSNVFKRFQTFLAFSNHQSKKVLYKIVLVSDVLDHIGRIWQIWKFTDPLIILGGFRNYSIPNQQTCYCYHNNQRLILKTILSLNWQAR